MTGKRGNYAAKAAAFRRMDRQTVLDPFADDVLDGILQAHGPPPAPAKAPRKRQPRVAVAEFPPAEVSAPRAEAVRRGRPPVSGRYAAGATTFRGIAYPSEQAELIRLAAEGAGETPAAYIVRTALEAARRDLAGK